MLSRLHEVQAEVATASLLTPSSPPNADSLDTLQKEILHKTEVGRGLLRTLDMQLTLLGQCQNSYLQIITAQEIAQCDIELTRLCQHITTLCEGIKEIISFLNNMHRNPDPKYHKLARYTELYMTQKLQEAILRFSKLHSVFTQKKAARLDRTKQVAAVTTSEALAVHDVYAQKLAPAVAQGRAQQAYLETREKHQDIVHLEESLQALSQLFQDMALLTIEQEDQLNHVETAIIRAGDDVESGIGQLTVAQKLQAQARKRACCLVCCLVGIAVALLLALSIYFR